uniref:Uncharacterized protein n=1 Tax=Glossina pallidipes TaxID=7398 RepID=A0A1A9ZYR5_GLOPL
MKHISEVSWQENSVHITTDEAVEAFEPRSSKSNNTQQESSSIGKINRGQANTHNMSRNNVDRPPSQATISLAGQPRTSQMVLPTSVVMFYGSTIERNNNQKKKKN